MWNGLKISEVFFEEYGLPMLEKNFAEYKDEIAACGFPKNLRRRSVTNFRKHMMNFPWKSSY